MKLLNQIIVFLPDMLYSESKYYGESAINEILLRKIRKHLNEKTDQTETHCGSPSGKIYT